MHRPDTDFGNLNVSASTLSDWGEAYEPLADVDVLSL